MPVKGVFRGKCVFVKYNHADVKPPCVCSVTWFLMDSVQSDSGGTSAAASAHTPRTPSV